MLSLDSIEQEAAVAERAPSLLPTFCVTLNGWESEDADAATEFGHGLALWVTEMSRYLDLSRLEEIVVATDYAGALAAVDRGSLFGPAVATKNEYGEGGAMALPVMRGEELWSVVVIWTGLVRNIMDTNHADHGLAVQTLFHELAHVDDQRFLDRTFPGGYVAAKPRDGREKHLLPIAHRFWSEHSAQSAAARFAPAFGLDLVEMLRNALKDVDDQIIKARRQYRLHGNMDVFWPVVVERVGFLFQALGYAVGHGDGLAIADGNDSATHEAALSALDGAPQGWLVGACREAVKPLSNLHEWKDLDPYLPLIAVLETLLNGYGLFTKPHGDGIYIDAPYRTWAEL